MAKEIPSNLGISEERTNELDSYIENLLESESKPTEDIKKISSGDFKENEKSYLLFSYGVELTLYRLTF